MRGRGYNLVTYQYVLEIIPGLRRHLQERFSNSSPDKGCGDEVYLKLRTSTAPPLKLIDLPGLDQRIMNDSIISNYAEHNDAILLVVVPSEKTPEISSLRALKLAKEFDANGTRTVGVITKIDQAATDQKTLAAIQALLLNKGPRNTSDIPWVALIGQSVSIASAQSGSVGSENSLESAWRAESESLKSILTGAPQSKLGKVALVDTLARQIRNRMKVRLPNLLSGLQDKSQVVENALVRLGEQMVHSSEGTRAIALELCREFEDRFLQHIATGEGSGWKIVASFEGSFPNRIKQLPLDRHFDINNVKRIVLEADGYQPYLISPEKGLRSLIKGVLELAKEPSRLCVDEVHRVLVDIVSAAANATPGLGRYPPFKREVVTIASAALDGFKNEAKKMVVALVDMERAFVPPQHFIRLVQRRNVAISSEFEEEVVFTSERRGSGFAPDCKLFVGNLPFNVGSVELAATAGRFNGYDLDGRQLRVNYGPPPPKEDFGFRPPRGRGDGGGSFGSSNRLYAGNLSWGVDDLALETLFSEQGKVLEAKVVYDRETDRSTFQSGFITCNSTEEMNNAISSLDGVDLDACDWGLKVLIVVDEIGEGHESCWVTCRLDISSKLGIEEITGALGVCSESFRFGLVAFGLAIDMASDFWLLCSFAAYSNWMDRQRREEEQKGRTSRKGHEAEQAVLNRATSPQTGSQQTGGTLKQLKDKISPPEKDTQEGSALKTVGPSGEITAGFLLKKSSKTNGWSRRWFVLNEKSGKLGYTKKQEERNMRGVITLEECNVEEIPDEEPPSKGSKDKKGNASDSGKVPNLMFKITSKVPYKTVLKAHNAVLLKAESVADKVEWVSKIRNVIQPSMGAQGKSGSSTDAGLPMRQSLSDGSLDTMARRPADPEEELRWMSQEVRGYVEAVLNSLAANVPKAVVLCQVEKAKEDMLNQLYSSIRIEELLLEDQNVKRRRERFQKQSSILSKLTRQLSIHDNRAAAASSWSDDGVGEAESSPRNGVPSDDWRSAFNAAANGNNSSYSRSSSNGHSRRYSDPANGDEGPGSNSGSRRTPNRLPPTPPQSGSSLYKY
ncbi:hypothetical protein GIB67_000876 [Kingdonia uniflora]|uniref:Dynamin GTPase n=1 Tax=Kingdonia uniflora TaxID=39325 RepID=A0A7J7LFS9_9MAGN|nr:hypothetical protein GIB67_000876 [Kingdonia uniflora]